MANWNNPINTTVYTSVLSELKGRDTDAAFMFDPAVVTPTNLSNNTIRWNSVNSRFEILNGTWGELDTLYDINVTSLNGLTASDFVKLNPGSNQTITSGKLIFDNNSSVAFDLKGGTADNIYFQFFADAAAQSTRSGYIGYNGVGDIDLKISNEYTNGDIRLITNGSGFVHVTGNLTSTGDITGDTINATTATSSGDNSALGYSSTNGAILTGQGSTNDVVLRNDANQTALRIPTGTQDVVIEGNLSAASISGTASSAANESSDTTCWPLFALDATGVIAFKTNAGFAFNAATGELQVTKITGDGTNLTGSAASFTSGACSGNAATATSATTATTATTTTGNAGTATKWQTARNFDIIGDVTGAAQSFDGSANLTFTASLATNSVGQNEVKTTSQTIEDEGGGLPVIATGGRYVMGHTMDSDGDPNDNPMLERRDTSDNGTNGIARWSWYGSNNNGTCNLYYINTSPPYDLGDGDIPMFVYGRVDNTTGIMETFSISIDPIWAYNGPTNIVPSRYDKENGRIYRTRKDMSTMPMTLAQARVAGPNAVRDYFLNYNAADEYEEEITQEIKNADQNIVPHVFEPAPGKTLIMLDPVSEIMEDLLVMRHHDEGIEESVNVLKNYVTIGNSQLNRKGPNGLLIPSVKWKNTL